ncbi:MAG: response regulator transcription factor [Spirochaetes bacterium]|nr:response regulator transcription factor [Spirochaetota bacterium]
MSKKVAIIDDDIKLQELLKDYLKDYNYDITSFFEGSDILEKINSAQPDIIILDIMLPGKDGMEILKDIRKESSVPVIMLTAKGEDTDRIIGLELGADDYLSKPFNPRELLARMKAVMRRTGNSPDNKVVNKSSVIETGGMILDSASMKLVKGNKSVELSKTEYRLLEALMGNHGIVISRDELMNLARGRDFIAFERSIDVHISKLRTKVESVSGKKEQIKTVWGTGYMFVSDK